MNNALCRWLVLVAVTLAVVGLIRLSLVVGWTFDNSILPPFGGGWPCYRSAFIGVFALPVGVILLACLPSFAKRVARIIAG